MVYFPTLALAPAYLCCCHLTRGRIESGRRKLVLHAIAARLADLYAAGVTSPMALVASDIWQNENVTHGWKHAGQLPPGYACWIIRR